MAAVNAAPVDGGIGKSGHGHIKGIRNDYKRIKYSMNFIFRRKSLENNNNNK